MTLEHFFKIMEQIHFVFGFPVCPDQLQDAIEGEVL